MSNTPKFELPVAGGVATKQDLERNVNRALDQMWGAVTTGLVDPVEGADLIDRMSALVGEGHDYRASAEQARDGAEVALVGAQIARAGAESARDAIVTAGAWTYMPATVAAMNALTGMTAGQTALVLQTMAGYRYSGTAWQPLNIIMGNIAQVKEDLQKAWSPEAGVIRRMPLADICTLEGRRLLQNAADVTTYPDGHAPHAMGSVSGLIPVKAGEYFRMELRGVDPDLAWGVVKAQFHETNAAPSVILAAPTLTREAYNPARLLHTPTPLMDDRRAHLVYFRIPRNGFLRVGCFTAQQRAISYLEQVTEDLFVKDHLFGDKPLLRKLLRDPDAIVLPQRTLADPTQFDLSALTGRVAGRKFVSYFFNGQFNSVNEGPRAHIGGNTVPTTGGIGNNFADLYTSVQLNQNNLMGVHDLRNMELPAGADRVSLAFPMIGNCDRADNSTIIVVHDEPLIVQHNNGRFFGEGESWPVRVVGGWQAHRVGSWNGDYYGTVTMGADETNAQHLCLPLPVRGGSIVRVETHIDQVVTELGRVLVTGEKAHRDRWEGRAVRPMTMLDWMRPFTFHHPDLRPTTAGVTAKVVCYVPVDHDCWITFRSRGSADVSVRLISAEDMIQEIKDTWPDLPSASTVLGGWTLEDTELGRWSRVTRPAEQGLRLVASFPVPKGYVLRAKTNVLNGPTSPFLMTSGYSSIGKFPVVNISPLSMRSHAARLSQAVGWDGYPMALAQLLTRKMDATSFWADDGSGVVCIHVNLEDPDVFTLADFQFDYVKIEEFIKAGTVLEVTPDTRGNDVAGELVDVINNVLIPSVGRRAQEPWYGTTPMIPLPKGTRINVKTTAGAFSRNGVFFYFDPVTKERKIALTCEYFFPSNAISHGMEYFWEAPEDGYLILGWGGHSAETIDGLKPWSTGRDKPLVRILTEDEWLLNTTIVETRDLYIPIEGHIEVNFVGIPLPTNQPATPFDRLRTGVCQVFQNGNLLFNAYLETGLQGQSSREQRKTNYDIKLYNHKKQRITMRLGPYMPTNKLVLKGYMFDGAQIRDPLSVNFYKHIRKHTAYPNNLGVDPRLVDQIDTFPLVNRIGQMSGVTEGVPVDFLMGGHLMGNWTLRAKKDMTNYGIQEGNARHIWMQSDWQPNTELGLPGAQINWGSFNWNAWECTHPEMPPHVAPTDPDVLADINRFFTWAKGINDGTISLADTHQDYISLIHWLDYFILFTILESWDNWTNNVIISTVDGTHWLAHPYDMNTAWGILGANQNTTFSDAGTFAITNNAFWSKFINMGGGMNAKTRYAQLRAEGVLDVQHLVRLIDDLYSRQSNAAQAKDKLCAFKWPTAQQAKIDDASRIITVYKNRLAYLDARWL